MIFPTIRAVIDSPRASWLNRHPRVRGAAAWFGITWTPDDPAVHTREMFMAVALTIALACFLWAPTYAVFGEYLAAAIPGSYGVLTIIGLRLNAVRHRHRLWGVATFTMFMILPTLLMLALNGYAEGSAVIVWSLLAPLGALVWWNGRIAAMWSAVFGGLLVLTGVLEAHVAAPNLLPGWLKTGFFVGNIGVVSWIAFALLRHHVEVQQHTMRLLDSERERSEALLLNVLPEETAARLKAGESTIADHHPSASVLFADVVGYTSMTADTDPARMLAVLNEIFSHFDMLAVEYGVEKIRTIGDGYMAVCGAPIARDDHAERLADMALRMLDFSMPSVGRRTTTVRIGIDSGPMIGGVVGTTKFHYDVWGDVVNVAARMETDGEPGRIQLGPGAAAMLADRYELESRGIRQIKGKGPMETWFLLGRRPG
jgi:guanylate cyclase